MVRPREGRRRVSRPRQPEGSRVLPRPSQMTEVLIHPHPYLRKLLAQSTPRSRGQAGDVVAVGRALVEALREQGVGAVHVLTVHDLPDWSGAAREPAKVCRKRSTGTTASGPSWILAPGRAAGSGGHRLRFGPNRWRRGGQDPLDRRNQRQLPRGRQHAVCRTPQRAPGGGWLPASPGE